MGSIFHTHGYIQQQTMSDVKSEAFITLADLSTVISAKAPATGVDIKMAADSTITKALNKDFLITAFGDQPVYITISGMQITYIPNHESCKGSVANQKQSVMDFYVQNKVSNDPSKRIDVSIIAGGKSHAFKCAIMNLDIQNDTQGSEYGFCRYKITLVGVLTGGQ